jgi:hypothetical protein
MDQDLMEIWKSPDYRALRRQFERRVTEALTLAVGTETACGAVYEPGALPLPEPCLTCYKLYGV